MTITINRDDINYTLEEEKTAGDVFTGLTAWLEKSGMIIGGIQIDNKAMPLDGIEWRSIPIENIGNLSVEALSLREGRVRQLETARDYFIFLKASVESGDEEALKELSEGFTDLKRILPHLLNEGPHPSIMPHLETTMSKGFQSGNASIILESSQLAILLEARRKEAENPESEARSAAAALALMAEELEDVAVLLQTGKDKKAMETIIRLTEMLQTFMRSLTWIDGGEGIEEITNDMNGILSELEEALKVNDTVLIGDLLEYEIKPRLLNLPAGLNFSGKALS